VATNVLAKGWRAGVSAPILRLFASKDYIDVVLKRGYLAWRETAVRVMCTRRVGLLV